MSGRDLTWTAILAIAAVAIGATAVAATSSGISPAAVMAAAVGCAFVVSPEWFVLAALAVPGGLLERVAPADALALAALIVTFRVIATIGFPKLWTALTPLAAVVGLTFVHRASIDPLAAAAAGQFRLQLVYYLGIALIAGICVRERRLSPRRIMLAAVIGAGGGAVIYAGQVVLTGAPLLMSAEGAATNPGFLFYRTHFGYLMCVGLAASFGLRATLTDPTKKQLSSAAIAGFMVMILVSMTRSAWIIAVIMTAAAWSKRAGSRSVRWSRATVVVVVAALLGLLMFEAVPLVRQRLAGDISGGLSQSIQSGSIGTGRLYLWRELAEEAGKGGVAGNGFGHMWSLSAITIFGADIYNVEENPFVYAHNDWLYLFVDLGLVGATLWLVFWLGLLRARPRGSDAYGARWPAKFIDGTMITMLVAELVDNGLFIQALSEPFFACAGLLALGVSTAAGDALPSRATVPHRTDHELAAQ